MKRIILRLLLGTAVCVMSLAVPSWLDAQTDGAAIFKSKCVMCHGPNGDGNTPSGKALKAKDLRADDTQKKSGAELADVVAKGRNKMPAFGQKLTPEQIQAVVGYIHQLGKK